MTAFVVEADSIDDETDLEETVKDALPGDVTVLTTTIHDDWETGDPCPECGNTRMSVLVPVEDIFRSDDGDFTYQKHGDFVGDILSVRCLECEATLLDHPTTMDPS